jgi:error-prone DNA polymerase
MKVEYAELQCKTNFSFLRGASEASEYIEEALKLGLSALAITDVNGVYALPRAFEALRENPGLKLISGAELKIKDHPPLTFLARDRAGYGLLCRMITEAHVDKEKGQAELTLLEVLGFLSEKESMGLVALTKVSPKTNLPVLKESLGERLFLSLSNHLDGMQKGRARETLAASEKFGIRGVATNDVHYHRPERSRLQDALVCVREGVNLKTAGFKLFSNESRHLKSPHEMAVLFKDLPSFLKASVEIAESCQFSLSELKYQYPSEWIPQGYTAQKYMEELVWKGANEKHPSGIPDDFRKQILAEFSFTEKMNYADYFLTVYDIVKYAKDNDIYCQGRGSAANSVICYCLGITVVNPVKMNLLFERFVSEERGEPPDIDVDFEHERREEVIQHIYDKYGRHRAAMISAVRTYRRRSAFLEISKAVGVPIGTVSADRLEIDFNEIAGPLAAKRDIIDQLVSELKGFPRHLSIHSCGFTLSAKALTETVPIEPARMEKRTICQWDKNDLDTLGLVKIDVLSLGFLTAMRKACKIIGIHFSEIPQEKDDPNVYALIKRADTIGTFQIESRAQITTLGVTQPENFYDLVVEVALVRPGPNVGEMKSPYITRKENAKRGIPYVMDDPIMEKILGRTFGIPIFQEQVMKLAVAKAGFSPGEADQLRRAIAAWRSAGPIDDLSHRFYQGLLAGGMEQEQAKELFGYLKGFSEYGFPESHAASFAILSYLSAWLKCYYPAELLIGLINSQPMGFYPVDVLINDFKRHGVEVLPIDPNLSEWDATLEKFKTVRMGFRNVHGVRKEDVAHLIEERKKSPFTSIHDFLARTRFHRDAVETLAMSDVFSSFGLDQRHSFWKSIELQGLLHEKEAGQLSLFEKNGIVQGTGSVFSPPVSSPSVFSKMTLYESILEDYRGLGYSLRGSAMKGIRAENKTLPRSDSRSVKKLPQGALATYAGIVLVLQRPPTANGVAFMTLEDEWGSVDVIFFEKIYLKYLHLIRGSRFLLIKGKVEWRGKSLSVLANYVTTFNVGTRKIIEEPISPGEHPISVRRQLNL